MLGMQTKDEIIAIQKEGMERLISFAGSPKHLALMLDVPLGSTSYWRKKERISTFGMRAVMNHPILSEEFTIDELRPDKWKLEKYFSMHELYPDDHDKWELT